jgi:all-trans-8'-apo-beta-carotenal 15,15'-oxygenase
MNGPTSRTPKDRQAVNDFAPGLERAFTQVPPERDQQIAVVGDLPPYVRGSYYAIGPGRFSVAGTRYGHWLDGDGLVLALHLGVAEAPSDGRVARVVHRFVRGTKQVDEAVAAKALYRTFGTAFPGDRLRRGLGLESPTNVNVHPWQGHLLAYGEQALPWRLDAVTLETLGEESFGRLSPASPLSAHPWLDGRTGELANFGVGFSPTRPTLTYYRINADGALVVRKRHAIDHPVSIHDFALSEHFATFDLAPYVLDFGAFRAGASMLDALTWKPELARTVLVLDRESGLEVARVPMPAGYCLHGIEAWEERETLVVDMIEMDEPVYDQYLVPELFPDARSSRMVRYRINLPERRVVRREVLDGTLMCDFPISDPRCSGRGCDSFFASAIGNSRQIGRKFFDRLVRVDWRAGGEADAWQAPSGVYLGAEAGFVPDPDNRAGGAVILPVFEPATDTSRILIFDATRLAAGPRAEMELPVMLPPLFHAWFEPKS